MSLLIPPGTRLLDPPPLLPTSTLKLLSRKDGIKGEIVLQPQPSSDPSDPLNWPQLKKEVFFATLLLATATLAVISPFFIPAFGQIADEFGVPVGRISRLNGICVFFYGLSSFLGIVLSKFTGRRLTLIGTLVLEVAGLGWGANARSYRAMLGARVLQGLGVGAFASMGNSLIGDVFFLHEIGWRTGVWQLAWVGATSVTPLVSGRIITLSSWRTGFYGLMGLTGACLVLVWFGMPESTFSRESTNSAGVVDGFREEAEEEGCSNESPDFDGKEGQKDVRPPGGRGRMDWGTIGVTMARPFAIMFTPNVFWGCITYAWLFTNQVLFGAVYSQIFGGEPYNLDISAVGKISGVAPLVGSLLACLLAGPLADLSARVMARRNKGWFEPEFYLVLMLPSAGFTLAGLLGWGFSVDDGRPVVLSAFCIGVTYFGLTFGYVGTILYSTSCFPARGGDAFGVVMLVKSSLAFGCTFIVNDWLDKAGPVRFFSLIGSVSTGLGLLGVPMFIFGKRLRRWSSESRVLGWTTR